MVSHDPGEKDIVYWSTRVSRAPNRAENGRHVSVAPARLTASFSPTLKNNKIKRSKTAFNPRRSSKKEKVGGRRKKAPQKLYQKSGCWAFLFEKVEESKWRTKS